MKSDMASPASSVETWPPMASPAAKTQWTFRAVALRVWRSWATRSLAIGGIATVVDVVVGLSAISIGLSTRVGAMAGVAVGAAFTFFANRYFAFREHDPKLAKPALKFLLATCVAMLVHGQLVVVLCRAFGVEQADPGGFTMAPPPKGDGAHVLFVVAKMIADVAVFSVGQLLVLRYLVFPKRRVQPSGAGRTAPAPGVEQVQG